MKASELRIGNLIFDQGKITIVNTGTIWAIECYQQLVERKELEPIPLTEEWMISFGILKFVSGIDIYREEWSKDDFILKRTITNDFLFHGVHIEYVHQLQNLYFALTQTELIYTPKNK